MRSYQLILSPICYCHFSASKSVELRNVPRQLRKMLAVGRPTLNLILRRDVSFQSWKTHALSGFGTMIASMRL